MIAVVTAKRFDHPDSIALTVAFNGYRPSTGKVPTWGYIYDRNGDGKIDYMALVSGAGAFKSNDFPEHYPLRKQPFTRSELEYFVAHCSLIFNHWADDNFDGDLDAVVHVDMDSVRDWVERHIVVRTTKFDHAFDDAWAFHNSIDDEPEQLFYTPERVPFHSLEKPKDEITWKMFQDKSAILQLLNRAVKACSLKADSFFHPEVKE